jgi:hypothetical protein
LPLITAGIGAVVNVVSKAVEDYTEDGQLFDKGWEESLKDYGGAALDGAITGGCAALGPGGATACGAIAAAGKNLIYQTYQTVVKEEQPGVNVGEVFVAGGLGIANVWSEKMGMKAGSRPLKKIFYGATGSAGGYLTEVLDNNQAFNSGEFMASTFAGGASTLLPSMPYLNKKFSALDKRMRTNYLRGHINKVSSLTGWKIFSAEMFDKLPGALYSGVVNGGYKRSQSSCMPNPIKSDEPFRPDNDLNDFIGGAAISVW